MIVSRGACIPRPPNRRCVLGGGPNHLTSVLDWSPWGWFAVEPNPVRERVNSVCPGHDERKIRKSLLAFWRQREGKKRWQQKVIGHCHGVADQERPVIRELFSITSNARITFGMARCTIASLPGMPSSGYTFRSCDTW